MHTEALKRDRVQLTNKVLNHFFDNIFKGDISTLSSGTGLPYQLIYNLVHGRINSISAADYRKIFGEDPPTQKPRKVDGQYFRGMVKLWLFLDNNATEKDLYDEFYQGKRSKQESDYRIFSGFTKTVESKVEKIMEKKFLQQGMNPWEIRQWIQELDLLTDKERVSYEKVKPLLDYLNKNLKAHPSRLLNQCITRYESKELKSISRETYNHLLNIKERTEKAVASDLRLELERIREEVYGEREGFTRFSEVEEELAFLKKYAGKGARRYLDRSIGNYRRMKLKRIDSRRVAKIREDCDTVIRQRNDLLLAVLPNRYLKKKTAALIYALRKYLVMRMSMEAGLVFEKLTLMPRFYAKEEFVRGGHGFVSIHQAARLWNMSDRAFDLLLAHHGSIFKKIGRHDRRWLFSDLYLEEIAKREGFSVIREKYEWLAKQGVAPLSLQRRTFHADTSAEEMMQPIQSAA